MTPSAAVCAVFFSLAAADDGLQASDRAYAREAVSAIVGSTQDVRSLDTSVTAAFDALKARPELLGKFMHEARTPCVSFLTSLRGVRFD